MADLVIINPADLPLAPGIADTDDFLVIKNGVLHRAPKTLVASSLNAGGGGGAVTLSAPTLSATVISSSQINLSWNNVANESSYQLQRSPAGANTWADIATPAADATSFNNTGLTASTAYDYRIRAVGNGTTFLTSPWSNTASGTTSAGGSFQPESSAYFAANTGLTTPQQNAIDAFVVSVKSIGWSKFRAIYLPVWGSSTANRWNLINPADTNGAYRLTWNGSVTHGAGWIKSDGSTGYANTHFNASTGLTATNCGLSVFIKNKSSVGDDCAIGSSNSDGSQAFAIFPAIGTGVYGFCFSQFTVEDVGSSTQDCFISMSRLANNDLKTYFNTNAAQSNTTVETNSAQNIDLYLLAMNRAGTADRHLPADADTHQMQFAAIHEGLTGAETTTLRNAFNTLKTALAI